MRKRFLIGLCLLLLALAVNDTDVDADIQDWRVKDGESQTYQLHGQQFSLKASASAISTRIYLKHEVNY